MIRFFESLITQIDRLKYKSETGLTISDLYDKKFL
jgi:hypothetical protein